MALLVFAAGVSPCNPKAATGLGLASINKLLPARKPDTGLARENPTTQTDHPYLLKEYCILDAKTKPLMLCNKCINLCNYVHI